MMQQIGNISRNMISIRVSCGQCQLSNNRAAPDISATVYSMFYHLF